MHSDFRNSTNLAEGFTFSQKARITTPVSSMVRRQVSKFRFLLVKEAKLGGHKIERSTYKLHMPNNAA